MWYMYHLNIPISDINISLWCLTIFPKIMFTSVFVVVLSSIVQLNLYGVVSRIHLKREIMLYIYIYIYIYAYHIWFGTPTSGITDHIFRPQTRMYNMNATWEGPALWTTLLFLLSRMKFSIHPRVSLILPNDSCFINRLCWGTILNVFWNIRFVEFMGTSKTSIIHEPPDSR